MMKKTLVGLMGLLFVAAVAFAHGGDEKKILGTVKGLHENHLMVTATDGDEVTVTLTGATKIFKGEAEGSREDLVEGVRVIIEMDEHGKSAATIRIGVKKNR